MKFKEYEEFVKGIKVYPEKHAITYPIMGLVGELGEVAEKYKKFLRGDEGSGFQNAELMKKELGDVLWYLTSLADDLGFTLEDVAQTNVDKLSSRKERNVLKGNGDER